VGGWQNGEVVDLSLSAACAAYARASFG
jgi:hypothetical protein